MAWKVAGESKVVQAELDQMVVYQQQDKTRHDQTVAWQPQATEQVVALQATAWKPLMVAEQTHQNPQLTWRDAGRALQNPQLTWPDGGWVLLNPQLEQMQGQMVQKPLAEVKLA